MAQALRLSDLPLRANEDEVVLSTEAKVVVNLTSPVSWRTKMTQAANLIFRNSEWRNKHSDERVKTVFRWKNF